MKKIFIFIFILCFFYSAYAMQIVSMTFSEKVTKDYESINITDTFDKSTSKIHCIVKIRNGSKGSVVEGVWVSVDAIDTPNYVIDSAKVRLPGADASVHFSISKPRNDWPTGNYKLKIYVNNTYITYAPFKIVNGAVSQLITKKVLPRGNNNNMILGKWNCSMYYMNQNIGSGIFEFGNDGKADINGKIMRYTLERGGILKVYDRSGVSVYNYNFSGNILKISYQDGATFDCVKLGNSYNAEKKQIEPYAQNNIKQKYAQQHNNMYAQPYAEPYARNNQRNAQNAPQRYARNYSNNNRYAQNMNSNNNWQLQGTFCSWSGSSYGSSSYSNTKYISFDGQGRWTYGESSSYSGGSGMYAGQGGQDSGTYRVQGNVIYYKTNYGEQGAAQVHMRQNNGRITEIMVDGQLYSPSLCE
jgi:hypothetical protein